MIEPKKLPLLAEIQALNIHLDQFTKNKGKLPKNNLNALVEELTKNTQAFTNASAHKTVLIPSTELNILAQKIAGALKTIQQERGGIENVAAIQSAALAFQHALKQFEGIQGRKESQKVQKPTFEQL